MSNEMLRGIITDTYLGVIDINGYKYNTHKMRVNTLDDITMLMPIFDDVEVGDCFETTDWVLTCLAPCERPMEVVVRVDKFTRCLSEGFVASDYVNSRVTGMLCSSSKCMLKEIGVDRTPFYNATLKVRNPFKESFDMYVLAFAKQAKLLSTIPSGTVIEVVVSAKRRRKEKGWEFPIAELKVKSEV